MAPRKPPVGKYARGPGGRGQYKEPRIVGPTRGYAFGSGGIPNIGAFVPAVRIRGKVVRMLPGAERPGKRVPGTAKELGARKSGSAREPGKGKQKLNPKQAKRAIAEAQKLLDEFELGDGIGLVSEIKALEVQKPNPENRAGLKRLKTDFWRKMVAFAIKSGASLEAMKIIDGFRKVDFGEW